MKVLELFAGSRSIGKAAEDLGFEVFSSDITDFGGIDYVTDILNFDVNKVPFHPHIIWASPPCTTFSIASCSTHFTVDKKPKTEKCLNGIQMVLKTLEIIEHFKPKYFYIENPRGLLRKMDFMQDIGIRHTVTYCKYGDTRMKPTDIWTNNPNWSPRPMCKNYKYNKKGEIINRHCHHESARRGAKTGTQGVKSSKFSANHERSKIPYQLCKEILLS